jgi:hypothetical protein
MKADLEALALVGLVSWFHAGPGRAGGAAPPGMHPGRGQRCGVVCWTPAHSTSSSSSNTSNGSA